MDPQQLDVATPDRVALQLPVAGVGYRGLAYLTDAAAMFTFWIVLYFASSFLTNVWDDFKALSGIGQTIAVFGVFAAQWCYWTVCEIAWNGQTVGKRLLRVRVVRMDGAPITPLESVLRNLMRFVDFLPAGYAIGLISMLATRDHRRVGDLVAGTIVIRDEAVDLSRYAVAPLVTPVAITVRGQLTAEEHELVLAYLQRAPVLEQTARTRLATKLVTHFAEDAAVRTQATASLQASEAFLRELAGSHA